MATETPRLLRLTDVQLRVPYSKPTIYAKMAAGLFPRPIKLSAKARAVAWIESEIDEHVRALIAASRGGQPDGSA